MERKKQKTKKKKPSKYRSTTDGRGGHGHTGVERKPIGFFPIIPVSADVIRTRFNLSYFNKNANEIHKHGARTAHVGHCQSTRRDYNFVNQIAGSLLFKKEKVKRGGGGGGGR